MRADTSPAVMSRRITPASRARAVSRSVKAGGTAESYTPTGPEPLTCADIAEKLSVALGRTVPHVALPPGEPAAALRARGLPAQFADDVTALGREVAQGSLAATTTAVRPDRPGTADIQ